MNPSGFVVETANRLTYVGRAADDGERTVDDGERAATTGETVAMESALQMRWLLNTTTLFYLLVM